MYDGSVSVCKTRKIDPIFFRVQRFEMSAIPKKKISKQKEMQHGKNLLARLATI